MWLFCSATWWGCILCNAETHDACLPLSWVRGNEGETKKILSWENKMYRFGCSVCQLQLLRQMGILTTSFGAAKQQCALWEFLASSRMVTHHTTPGKMCCKDMNNTLHFAQYVALCFNNTGQFSYQEKHPLCKTRGPKYWPVTINCSPWNAECEGISLKTLASVEDGGGIW